MRRRRRHQVSEEPQLQRWLMPYADYVTLLLAFFILLYAATQTERDNYRQWLDALSASVAPLLGQATDEGAAASQTTSDPGTELPQETGLMQLAGQFETRLAPLLDKQWVQWQQEGDWLELQLSDALLFGASQSALSDNARAVLAEVATVLSANRHFVHVRGHTDHRPVRGDDLASNWQLSALRALAVLSELEGQGIAPQRLALEGYGRWQPVADNRTRQGRALNRRVVIAISSRQWQGEAPLHAELFTPSESEAVDDVRLFRKPGGGLLITTRKTATR